MKIVTPSYYKKFKCIGSKCKHNCCIGWEIDIDKNTMDKYSSIDGELGARLKKSISKKGEYPHFILARGKRCPFLNKDNLCDIILKKGEGYLCEICDAHPRFKNFFSDRVEIGIGLCCEEAARIILSENRAFSLETYENGEPCGDNSDFENQIIAERDALIGMVNNGEDLNAVLPDFTLDKWATKLLKMEIMSKEWKRLLSSARKIQAPLSIDGYEREAKNLLSYFLFRYIANEEYDEKITTVVAFCVLSVQIITTLWRNFAKTEEDMIEICRLYSQEIEYSTENVYDLFDIIEGYDEI